MQQIQWTVILLLITGFLFVPTAYLKWANDQNHQVKQALNLSARVLADSLENTPVNMRELSMGYARDSTADILVDKNRLLWNFNAMLERNLAGRDGFDAIRERVLAKLLLYGDRFYVAGRDDIWEGPYFFTCIADAGSSPVNGEFYEKPNGRMLLLNLRDDKVQGLADDGSNIEGKTAGDFGISEELKNDLIIDRINGVIAQYTGDEPERKNGLMIGIRNDHRADKIISGKESFFNILKGITFFVVYGENRSISITGNTIEYKNYNVVGYTLVGT